MRRIFPYFTTIAMLLIGFPADAETRWQVVEPDSILSFQVAIGGETAQGGFADWAADITYDPATPSEAFVAVDIAIGSVTIDAAQAAPLITGAQWLDAAGYPAARFVGRGFEGPDPSALAMPGMLSLKGIDVPVSLKGSIDVNGDIAHATFETTLPRSIFGIGSDTPAVAENVHIQIILSAIRSEENTTTH